MCVCDKRWDYDGYWAKTFTSFAFNFPHFMTPFQIYLVCIPNRQSLATKLAAECSS